MFVVIHTKPHSEEIMRSNFFWRNTWTWAGSNVKSELQYC